MMDGVTDSGGDDTEHGGEGSRLEWWLWPC